MEFKPSIEEESIKKLVGNAGIFGWDLPGTVHPNPS